MRLTTAQAVLLAVGFQCSVYWLAFTHPAAAPRLPEWLALLAYILLYGSVGAVAAHNGRRWSAPIFATIAAFAASALICVVGVLSGEFLERGFGPASVLSYLIWMLGLGLVGGIVGLVFVLALIRSTSRARAT